MYIYKDTHSSHIYLEKILKKWKWKKKKWKNFLLPLSDPFLVCPADFIAQKRGRRIGNNVNL